MNLLRIDSSILGDHSVSRQISVAVVARLTQLTPGAQVTIVTWRPSRCRSFPVQWRWLAAFRLRSRVMRSAVTPLPSQGYWKKFWRPT
jgi:hypothetical protein